MLYPTELKAEPTEAKAPPAEDQYKLDLQWLSERKIITNADDWIGKNSFDGAIVAAMLHQMARHFEPTTTAADSLQVLSKRTVFRSSTYWKEKATAGGKCGGDNVRTVIRNFVQAAEALPQ